MSDNQQKYAAGTDYYKAFQKITLGELQDCLLYAKTREEKAFYRTLLNFKLQLEQEKLIGQMLL